MKKIIEHIVVNDETIEKNDPFNVIDPVFWVVNIYEGEAVYKTSLAQFSTQQKFLNAIGWYLSEVNNGGHFQFYDNSTGIVWKDALAGLKEVGIKELEEILQESVSRFGGNPSLDRITRQKELETHNPIFDDLDDKIFALEKTSIIGDKMMQYIKEHKDAFYFDGNVQKLRH